MTTGTLTRVVRIALLGVVGLTSACAASDSRARDASIVAIAPPRPIAGGPTAPYRVESGDQLAVSFPYNAELNIAGPVGPDGRFTVPIIGNLLFEGLTLDQAAAVVSAALRREGIVENARPTVSVQQYGAVVYVGGEVRQPGPVKLPGRMGPLQAIISAGGLLDTAKSKQVVVLHRDPDGAIVKTDVDLRAFAHKGLPTGVTLRSHDIVFVPRSSIAEADLWIDQHINRLLPFSRSLNYSLGNTNVTNTVGTR